MGDDLLERLEKYKPVILIMGLRKDGCLESVLCVNRDAVANTVKLFEKYRVFSLREEHPNTFIKETIKNEKH